MKQYTLKLTRDELDWLFFQVMRSHIREADKFKLTGDATETRQIRDDWWGKAHKQGYQGPF